jgi:hypothetical protein
MHDAAMASVLAERPGGIGVKPPDQKSVTPVRQWVWVRLGSAGEHSMRMGALLMGISTAVLSFAATAETVLVKYRGPVDLGRFACESIHRSSLVQGVCYRSDASYLIVNLNGSYYHYCRVDSSIVRQFLAAPSMGRFFNQNIKGNFDCRLGGVPN